MLPSIPLAERLRPQSLDDVLGQEHITGPGSLMRQAIQTGLVPSLILWGPPGVGKTTLAQIIAQSAGLGFFQLSAVSSGVKEVREVIDQAKHQRGAVLFIDEIHRFNKGQQDALLGAVEKGTIRLIGATTENPSFEVNAALLSRSQVFVLKSLTPEHLEALLHKALTQDDYLKGLDIVLTQTEALVQLSGGDGRKLLNLLELLVQAGFRQITNDNVVRVAQQKTLRYDKKGEQHYDIISAFIKSMRGSDPNGAVYWMARMIEGGEDVKFIARRMLIFASEDVGNANPNALLLANACFDAVQKIGYPESRIILSQCATYLATSVKSNAAYEAIGAAQKAVKETGDLPVPLHLRNGASGLMKEMGYGENYQYSHLGENNFIEQEYLPEPLVGKAFYVPGENAREAELKRFLAERWKGKYGY
ncbi:MAG: replication-associated recombination protein A [Sphingobacteriia bacterium]|nr:MAG: replication-associated recombination protein A [Sphingobacteriia bacterium]